jgi:superfamily II DNA/RNA helicase
MTYTRRNDNRLQNGHGSAVSYNGQIKNNFRRGVRSRGVIKQLDPNLFIKKAKEDTFQQDSKTLSSVSFADFHIVEKLKRNIEEHGYSTPTPIQEQAIPPLLAGRDLIGVADTGSGKTAAFLISLINKSVLDRNQRVLILVPTRELAVQIADEFKIFSKGLNLESVAAIGGANIKRQSYAMRHNPHFVIATAGRLKDLIQ